MHRKPLTALSFPLRLPEVGESRPTAGAVASVPGGGATTGDTVTQGHQLWEARGDSRPLAGGLLRSTLARSRPE